MNALVVAGLALAVRQSVTPTAKIAHIDPALIGGNKP